MIERNCSTCFYNPESQSKAQCFVCFHHSGLPKWKSLEVKDCADCKYEKDLITIDLCQQCSELAFIGDRVGMWEPKETTDFIICGQNLPAVPLVVHDSSTQNIEPGSLTLPFSPEEIEEEKTRLEKENPIEWRVIPEFEKYEVSSNGQVRRIDTQYILKPFKSKWGYLMVDLSIQGKRTRKTVHRLVAETFLGVSDLPVNHRDGSKTNNALSNLEFVTHSENSQHAYDSGLREAPQNSDLSKDDIMDIVERINEGEKQKDIAHEYSLSPQAVCDIMHGRTWPDVTGIINNSKCNTGIETKRKYFPSFVGLVKSQFWHGGDKYKLSEEKEFTDAICEAFPGDSGVDWVLGTCMKYMGRFKNFGREKDLLKVATYMYILWLKGGFHLKENHDEDIFKK